MIWYFRQNVITEAIEYSLKHHISRYDVFKEILSLYIINIYDIFRQNLGAARYFLPRGRISREISYSPAGNVVRRRNFGIKHRNESENSAKNKNGSKKPQYFYAHRLCCCSSRPVNLRRTSTQYSRVSITRGVIPSLIPDFEFIPAPTSGT